MVREFGLEEGINEVIGITIADWVNTAPIGVIVDEGIRVRLFENHTRKFVKKTGILYVNVIHDPVVFVIAAFEDLSEDFFESLEPPIIKNALSWIKFKADLKGNYAHLSFIDGGVLRRDCRAVNRGFNAVIEATVHATRYVLNRRKDLLDKIIYYGKIVERCGGKREKEAYKLLMEYIKPSKAEADGPGGI